jgi:spore maturation protein CgeB
VQNARVCLNLVRRANRDDHVMRSFEVPAMRGCMVTEDTPTHRALFGAEGEAVMYFQSVDELVAATRGLLGAPSAQRRLAEAAHTRIVKGQHTYGDRLEQMLLRVGV